MKLTKQQRIEAYEYAAKRIDKRLCRHICVNLRDWIQLRFNIYGSCDAAVEYFPELKPYVRTRPFWFNDENIRLGRDEDNEARLFILGSCILFAEEAED